MEGRKTGRYFRSTMWEIQQLKYGDWTEDSFGVLLLNYWNLLAWGYDVLSIKNKGKYIVFHTKSDLTVEELKERGDTDKTS